MPTEKPTAIEHSIEIDASPQQVWDVVSDVRNAPEWGEQTLKVFALGRGTRKGTVSININKHGFAVWPTTAKVVEYVPARRIANRINENFVVWAFELEPNGTGTTLIERRETPDGTSGLSNWLVKNAFGGQQKFGSVLSKDVSTSLKRIKAMVESRT